MYIVEIALIESRSRNDERGGTAEEEGKVKESQPSMSAMLDCPTMIDIIFYRVKSSEYAFFILSVAVMEDDWI